MADKFATLENGKLKLKPFGNIPVDALTEFEAYTSDGQEETTSTGFEVKSGYPYTTAVKSAGDYVIDFTAQMGQSNANKNVTYKIEYREGTSGAWIEVGSSDHKFPQSNGWDFVTSFRIITLATDTEFQVQVSWGNCVDGGTGRIRYAGIKVGKVAE
jgi:hypothetical protein